jgi:hypothetical protein
MLHRVNRLALVVLLSCGAPPQAPIAPMSRPEPTIALTETALGPLTPTTKASLLVLRGVLVGYTVIPVNVGNDPEFPSLEYQVFDADNQMFAIVPDDEGQILNVHVLTPKVTMAGRPWRVGAPFAGAVTDCDCWGGKTVCFKKGEHVAVTFDRRWRAAIDARGRRTLEGIAIKRLVWSPRPFGGDEYGGAEYGGLDDTLGP